MGIFKLFANMQIKFKLIAAFFFVTILFTVVAGIYQFSNQSIIKGYDFAIDNPIAGAFRLYEARLQINQSLTNGEKFKNTQNIENLRGIIGTSRGIIGTSMLSYFLSYQLESILFFNSFAAF